MDEFLPLTLISQIDKDVPRTFPENHYLHGDDKKNSAAERLREQVLPTSCQKESSSTSLGALSVIRHLGKARWHPRKPSYSTTSTGRTTRFELLTCHTHKPTHTVADKFFGSIWTQNSTIESSAFKETNLNIYLIEQAHTDCGVYLSFTSSNKLFSYF